MSQEATGSSAKDCASGKRRKSVLEQKTGITQATGQKLGVEAARKWCQSNINSLLSAATRAHQGHYEQLLRRMHFKNSLS